MHVLIACNLLVCLRRVLEICSCRCTQVCLILFRRGITFHSMTTPQFISHSVKGHVHSLYIFLLYMVVQGVSLDMLPHAKCVSLGQWFSNVLVSRPLYT